MGRGGRGYYDAVYFGLGDHRQRIREAPRSSLGDCGLESGWIGVRDGGERGVGVVGDDAKVVATHRAQPGQTEPEARRHEGSPAATAWRKTDARRAAMTWSCSASVRPGYMGSDKLPAAAASVFGRSASMPSSMT